MVFQTGGQGTSQLEQKSWPHVKIERGSHNWLSSGVKCVGLQERLESSLVIGTSRQAETPLGDRASRPPTWREILLYLVITPPQKDGVSLPNNLALMKQVLVTLIYHFWMHIWSCMFLSMNVGSMVCTTQILNSASLPILIGPSTWRDVDLKELLWQT